MIFNESEDHMDMDFEHMIDWDNLGLFIIIGFILFLIFVIILIYSLNKKTRMIENKTPINTQSTESLKTEESVQAYQVRIFYCPSCGVESDDDELRYCPNCGTKIK